MDNTTAIFYYSATGNSLSVARLLKNKLSGSELIPIIRYLKVDGTKKVINFHSIGLVFPTHHMGIPQLVRDFLEATIIRQNTYVFVVVTGGNPRLGAGIYQVNRLLKKNGHRLSAGFHVKMPATYFSRLPLFQKSIKDPDFKRMNSKITSINTLIQNNEFKLEREFWGLHFINRIKVKRKRIASDFLTVEEGCIRCGYCVMVCPLHNIQLSGSKHTFLYKCNACLACVHFCSKQVLQYKNKSRGKARYQHPHISIGDLMAQKR